MPQDLSTIQSLLDEENAKEEERRRSASAALQTTFTSAQMTADDLQNMLNTQATANASVRRTESGMIVEEVTPMGPRPREHLYARSQAGEKIYPSDLGQPPSFWESVHRTLDNLKPGGNKAAIANPVAAAFDMTMAGIADMSGSLKGVRDSMLTSAVVGLTEEMVEEKPWSMSIPMLRFSRVLADSLPEEVEEGRELLHYTPVTETGELMVKMMGEGFQQVRNFGTELGDKAFEATGSPLIATAVNIGPDTIAMLGSMFIGRPGMGKRVQTAAEQMLDQQARGKSQLFDTQIMSEFPSLTAEELARKSQVQSEVVVLMQNKNRTPEQQFKLDGLMQELDTITAKEFRVTNNETKGRMSPEEVLELATEDQLKKLDGEVFIAVGAGKKADPIILERRAGELSIKEGMEDVYAARLLGKEEVPVIIKEIELDAATRRDFSSRIQEFNFRARQKQEALEASLRRSYFEQAATNFWDRASPIKSKLNSIGGEIGRKAIRQFELMSGSTMRSRQFLRTALDDVYKDISDTNVGLKYKRNMEGDEYIILSEEGVLNEMVHSLWALEVTRPGRKGKDYILPGNFTRMMHEANLETFYKELGPTRYKFFREKANRIFDYHRMLLEETYKEGLITKKTYDKLKDFDYQPARFMELLDPETKSIDMKGNSVSVADSGVQFLEKGRANPIEMGARELLTERTLRTYNRIFKNRANVALAEFAKEFPSNGIVREFKNKQSVPKHMRAVEYFVNGEKKVLGLHPSYGAMWQAFTPDMTSKSATWMRMLSGTPLVKATAVGYNPAFIIRDFPRNVGHLLVAGRKDFVTGTPLYSSIIPKYLAEVSIDMAQVAGSAWRRDGFFNKLAEEGAFPQFLAHVAKREIQDGRSIESLGTFNVGQGNKVLRGVKEAVDSLSFLNEWSEITMRMAIAERSLKAQALQNMQGRGTLISGKALKAEVDRLRTDTEAVRNAALNARRVIDYAQSGHVTKTFDNVIPFLNPAFQATRTAVRGIKEDPIGSTLIYGQVAAGTGLLYLYNQVTNEQAAQSISDNDMASGINIVLPEHFNVMDDEGNVRYPYIHIAIDNAYMPLTGGINFTMRKKFEGRSPDSIALEIARHASVITPTSLIPPSIDAMYKLWGNEDFWSGNDVWRGDEDVEPWREFYGKHRENATPEFYINAARWLHELGMIDAFVPTSPERLKAVVDTMLADHPITAAGATAARTLFATEDPEAYQRQMWEVLKDAPGFGKVIRFGNMDVNAFADAERLQSGTPTLQLELNDTFDQKYLAFSNGNTDLQSMKNWIMSDAVPLEEKERLAARLRASVRLDEIKEGFPNMAGIPSKNWWVNMAENTSHTDRALIFYQEWIRRDQPGRAKMDRIINRLPEFGTAYFHRELERLKDLSGTKQLGTDIYSGLDFWN